MEIKSYFAVEEYTQWEPALSLINASLQDNNLKGRELFVAMKKSFQKSMRQQINSASLDLVLEDDWYDAGYVPRFIFDSMNLETIYKLIIRKWKDNNIKFLIAAGLCRHNKNSERDVMCSVYLGSEHSNTKWNADTKSEWFVFSNYENVQNALRSCAVSDLGKDTLKYYASFQGSEFDFIRAEYKEYEIFEQVKEFILDSKKIIFQGKRFYLGFSKKAEKKRADLESLNCIVQTSFDDKTDFIIIKNHFDYDLSYFRNHLMAIFEKMKAGSHTRFILEKDFIESLRAEKRKGKPSRNKQIVDSELNQLVSIYSSQSQKPSSLKQIQIEHPEFNLRLLDKIMRKVYKSSLSDYLRDKGILPQKQSVNSL